MKRLCLLAAMTVLSSSAHAFSFSVHGHRLHVDAPRHCRSTSCVSVSGVTRNVRSDDVATGATNPPAAPAPAAPTPAPAPTVPVATAQPVTPPITVYRPAATVTQPVAAPPTVRPIVIPPAPPPLAPIAQPVEVPRPVVPPPVTRVMREVEDEPADTPVGDWQTEGKGTVRIAECGKALCGYVLDAASNEKGEAVLINMKPKSDQTWSGNVYSGDSGDTYYGTIEMKGAGRLRVEACALGRFYCTGNNWTRVADQPQRMITARHTQRPQL